VGLVALASQALLLAACSTEAEPNRCDFRVGFDDAALADRTAVAVVEIIEGGCESSGPVLYRAEVSAEEGMGPPPPTLPAGTYDLRAVARDADCVRFGEGCIDVELPCPEGATVRIPVAAVGEVVECDPSECDDGSCPEMDGGVGCPPGTVRCGARCVDTTSDPDHCGVCDNACPARPNAAPVCTDGECDIACNPGLGNCDEAVSNGCETPLDSMAHCSACNTDCGLDHATESCATGRCEIVECDGGWDDCNDDPADGCESNLADAPTCGSCGNACEEPNPLCDVGTCVSGCMPPRPDRCDRSCVDISSDPSHCGGCGDACSTNHATASCGGGRCAIIECDGGWDDCDDDPSDGCETSLHTTSDCGACGVACDIPQASESCGTGTCTLVSCDLGREDCDDDLSNGCERDVRTLTDCGGCGVTCSLDHANETCATGSCRIATCESGFRDCDATASTGCESESATDPDNCGLCGNACDFGEVCEGGSCQCPAGCDSCIAADCSASSPCTCDSGCACSFECPLGTDCGAECRGSGTECELDAFAVLRVSRFVCEAGATCRMDARSASNVSGSNVVCRGDGTTCEIDCRSASRCNVACESGAACRIQCASASDCDFTPCGASQISCPGGVIACNTSCP